MGQNDTEIGENNNNNNNFPRQLEFVENTDKFTLSIKNPSVEIDGGAKEKDNTVGRTDPTDSNQSRLEDLLTYDKSKDTVHAIISSIHTGSTVQTRDGWRAFFIVVFYTWTTFQNFGNARTLGIFFKKIS